MAIPAYTPTDYQRRFKEAREAAGLTCQQMGDVLGMTRQSLNQFENGRQGIDLAKFLLACDTLGVRLEWLVYGSGARQRKDASAIAGAKKRPAARTRPRPAKAEQPPAETAPK